MKGLSIRRQNVKHIQTLSTDGTHLKLTLTPAGPSCSKVDNAVHRINQYPMDSVVCLVSTYPLDSDLSAR